MRALNRVPKTEHNLIGNIEDDLLETFQSHVITSINRMRILQQLNSRSQIALRLVVNEAKSVIIDLHLFL